MSLDVGQHEANLYSRFERRTSRPPIPLRQLQPEQIRLIQNEFLAKAKKGVIMIDLDRNLIDDSYGLQNEDEVVKKINEAKQAGYLVCLNSSRSASFLRTWQDKTHTDLPTFAENGRILDFPRKDLNLQVVMDERAYAYVDSLNSQISSTLKERFAKLYGKNYENLEIKLCTEDEPEVAIEKEFKTGKWDGQDNAYAIFLDGQTKIKTRVYAFKKSEAGARFDNIFYQRILNEIEKIQATISSTVQPQNVLYPEDKAILTYAAPLNKTESWQMLFRYFKELGKSEKDIAGMKFYHLGDGKEDDIQDPRVTVLAPANVNRSLKAKLRDSQIAPANLRFAPGVVHHLSNIIEGKVGL